VVVALALLSVYKVVLAPFIGGTCRFQPSCSDYMTEAIRLHGVTSGLRFGLKRLARCRPFGGHGIDPVPHP
jgi:putative membrane protein insertion efficiency factor